MQMPETQPTGVTKNVPERIAFQSQYRLDKETKRYVPITPKKIANSRKKLKGGSSVQKIDLFSPPLSPSAKASGLGGSKGNNNRMRKSNSSPKSQRQDFLTKVKARNQAIAVTSTSKTGVNDNNFDNASGANYISTGHGTQPPQTPIRF